jgi:hypothetical protein
MERMSVSSYNPAKLVPWLVVLLLASLAANAALLFATQSSFAKLHFARIFPLGYSEADPQDAPAFQENRPSVAYWGDSRAYSWALAADSQRWVPVNFAHGSQTSSQTLLQLQSRPVVRTSHALVQIGINDLHPLGALPGHQAQITGRLQANIRAIRDALLQRSEVVIFTTIFPPAPPPLIRRPNWDGATLGHIERANELIRGLADGRRVLVLDAHALLRGSGAHIDPGYEDPDFFLHVNPAAYARLNAQLQQLIARHPARRS